MNRRNPRCAVVAHASVPASRPADADKRDHIHLEGGETGDDDDDENEWKT